MDTFKKLIYLFLCSFSFLDAAQLTSAQEGKILFMAQQGEHQRALELYQESYKSNQKHDFELLHKIGIAILDNGFRQSDPETQLLTLFGAHFSLHDDAYYIIEESLKSKHPEIQLVAMQCLAGLQQDRADRAILKMLGSPILPVRYVALQLLCKKRYPQITEQIEMLMLKCPKELAPIFPSLFAQVGDQAAIKVLRRMLNDPSEEVRKEVILSVAKNRRDDFLGQIRLQATHFNYAQQEAAIYALGLFQDSSSIPKLEKLSRSQYPTVALAANRTLYQLGSHSSLEAIEKEAMNDNLFAIAILAEFPDESKTLLDLIQNRNLQVRINAILALLEQQNPAILPYIPELLIPDQRNLTFAPQLSPGKTITAWKATPMGRQAIKEDPELSEQNLALKEELLNKIRLISSAGFLKIASDLFLAQQNELVPTLVSHLEEINSSEAIQLLKKHQQQLGAPLIRNYCNLALYRMGESGPYGEQLRQWVHSQKEAELIRFRPTKSADYASVLHELTPEEKSKLLVQSFEAFAQNQDDEGIALMVELMATGHQKNRFALAGILVRMTQ